MPAWSVSMLLSNGSKADVANTLTRDSQYTRLGGAERPLQGQGRRRLGGRPLSTNSPTQSLEHAGDFNFLGSGPEPRGPGASEYSGRSTEPHIQRLGDLRVAFQALLFEPPVTCLSRRTGCDRVRPCQCLAAAIPAKSRHALRHSWRAEDRVGRDFRPGRTELDILRRLLKGLWQHEPPLRETQT
jgi:hypothetical protein